MSTRKGRPPGPVNEKTAKGALAQHLRTARDRKGLTREQLADKLGCSTTTVQRAEGGRTPPARRTVEGYARICDLDPEETVEIWTRAVNAHCGITRRTYTRAPHIEFVRTRDELAAALVRVWEKNGRPSTWEMERRTDRRYQEHRDYAFLSRSTAWRISRRESLPASERTLQSYLIACEVPERLFSVWVQTWGRVNGKRTPAHDKPAPARESRLATRRRSREREAVTRMRQAGLQPLDKFPGQTVPWSAVHSSCEQVSRYTLQAIAHGTAHCPACHEHLDPEGDSRP